MGMINMNTGIETPWPEHFFKGYDLKLVTDLITDEHIISVMDSICARALSVSNIT
jgi:hypothetical protein